MARSDRPRSVTITLVAVFLLGVWNVWRALVLFRSGDLLLALGVSLDPRARLMMALVWALVFIAVALGLLWRRALARWLLPLSLLLYALYNMAVLALFARSPGARAGWPFDLLLYGLALAWTGWALHRPAVTDYWRTPT
ncbi:MAG: hypothetical protein R3272_12865 [Candidatus Promineifilaceae bacterium]|nr:hypothetical protein [Candidatus Promineifilaceae bacterium]